MPPTSAAPTDLPAVLTRLLAEPGRPRLTWYGPGGERIELSGHVLVNWVVKTTNLLVEELDAGPGTRVLLDLPPHWRTVVWALGAWRAGACVALTDRAPGTGATQDDVVVTDRPDAHAGTAGALVAVALPALARRWDGALPPGAVDAASAVMTYADQLGWVPPGDGRAPAVAGLADVAHGDLVAWAQRAGRPLLGAAALGPDRTLLEPTDDGLDVVLAAVLATLAHDGSVVLVDPAVAAELAADGARRAELRAGERVTRDRGAV